MWFYFIGFIFVFLDYPLLLSSGGTVNLIPSFVGYLLLVLGSFLLGHENNHFKRARLCSFAAFVLSLAIFILDFFALPLVRVIELILLVLTTMGSLYITYEFTEGTKWIERGLYKKIGADKITSAWGILCLSTLLSFFMSDALFADYFPAAVLPCTLLHWLAFIWFEGSTFVFARKLSKLAKK